MAALLCIAQENAVQADQDIHENVYLSCPVPSDSQTLIAVGYGRAPSRAGYSKSQEKLMALRAAKLDAYRNLVAALHELSPHVTSPDAIIRSDGFIQGAFLIREQKLSSNRYTVEMGVPLKNYQSQVLKQFKIYREPLAAHQEKVSYDEWKDWIK